MSAMLSPRAAQEILRAGREPGSDWPAPRDRGAGWARRGGALRRLIGRPLGISPLVFVSCWATLTLLAAVLLGDARDGLFLAVLLALFQTVFYGLPVAAVVYYVLRRRRQARRIQPRAANIARPPDTSNVIKLPFLDGDRFVSTYDTVYTSGNATAAW